ncbi:lysozyme inhibitor LprI family protein [Paraflavisolibacter sp. H34]|uniref:lysozyme inhibitor LprI family protein n=1 Tax=Huijunlia imazamoxiresistens TaxID=3127457 RepID=UPI00301A365D
MRKLLIILTVIIVLSCKISFGQDSRQHAIDTKLKKCQETNGSTIGLVECKENAEKDWDAELNKYYKLLLGTLSVDEKQTLRETQREWLLFKEKEVKFYLKVYGSKDGSMWNVVIADKKMQIVRQRAIDLMGYYELLTQQ